MVSANLEQGESQTRSRQLAFVDSVLAAGFDTMHHLLMKLSVEDRIKNLLPARLYYPYKIDREARGVEPELRILRELVPNACTAIDVGANRGYYSWALSRVAAAVEGFEPNPVLAKFAQTKLGRRARLHEVALSDHAGVATLYVPRRASGSSLHIIGNLDNVYAHDRVDEIQVRLATLDSYGFENVGFLKIDVEGAEMEVLTGARETILNNRPTMLIELLAGIYGDYLTRIEQIKSNFGYDAWIVIGREKFEAKLALAEMEALRKTSNILFTPTASGGVARTK
jgi:FkbM family methyltransferase